MPTPTTVATRIPARIAGSASGSSTLSQDLTRRHPHRRSALQHRPIDTLQPRHRRSHDRQHGVERERNQRRARAYPANERQRNEKAEQRQAWHRLGEVRERNQRADQDSDSFAATIPSGMPIAAAKAVETADQHEVLADAERPARLRCDARNASSSLIRIASRRAFARYGSPTRLQRRWRVTREQAAFVQHGDAIGERKRFGQIVRHQQHRTRNLRLQRVGTRGAVRRA